MQRRLEGRVAVITAAGSGMGRAGALRFAAEGAHVVVTDLSGDAARAVCDEISAAGGAATGHDLDVSDSDAVRVLIDSIGGDHGRIDVLYNHAGIPGPAGLDVSAAEWDLAIDVNLRGAFTAVSAAVPWLAKSPTGGSIVFTASVSGLVGSPLSPVYSMTKGGVVTLAKSLALRLGPDGIRVNAICPGPIDTSMLPQFFGRDSTEGVEDLVESFVDVIPLGRRGRADEIAAAAAFLASDDASFITGVALPVDGGYLAR